MRGPGYGEVVDVQVNNGLGLRYYSMAPTSIMQAQWFDGREQPAPGRGMMAGMGFLISRTLLSFSLFFVLCRVFVRLTSCVVAMTKQ